MHTHMGAWLTGSCRLRRISRQRPRSSVCILLRLIRVLLRPRASLPGVFRGPAVAGVRSDFRLAVVLLTPGVLLSPGVSGSCRLAALPFAFGAAFACMHCPMDAS